jgi:hypothetical protein
MEFPTPACYSESKQLQVGKEPTNKPFKERTMTGEEFLTGLKIITVLAMLRFGVPAVVMWLIKLGCCHILHLKPS